MRKALYIMYEYGARGCGGAAAAATRLHLDMVAKGVDSRVVCVWGGGIGLRDEGLGSRVEGLRTWWWWLGVRVLHALTGRWTHAIGLLLLVCRSSPRFERWFFKDIEEEQYL